MNVTKSPIKRISAGGVVLTKNGKVLIMKQENEFVLPKGHVEDGESEHKAACREIKEETGVSVDGAVQLGLVHEFSYYFDPEKATKVVRLYGFMLDVEQKIVPNRDEGFTDGSWVKTSDALTILTHEDAKTAVRNAMARNLKDESRSQAT